MTLIELMISMLILAIVCVAWLEIIGIQSARKEARRREAVERLAGMMDAFMYITKTNATIATGCYYKMTPLVPVNGLDFVSSTIDDVNPVFTNDVTIGYQLRVFSTKTSDGKNEFNKLCGGKWTNTDFTKWGPQNWLVGLLYGATGSEKEVLEKVHKPFFVLPVCLGYQ